MQRNLVERNLPDALLQAENLAKRFGGIVATDDVSARHRGRANCMRVIGPERRRQDHTDRAALAAS